MPDFKLIDVAEQPYIYVDRKCAMVPAEIGKAMETAFGDIFAFMQENGIEPVEGPLSVYYSYDPETVEFRAGMFVSGDDAKKASGAVKADVTPAGRVVSFAHIGPYSKLGESYGQLMGWLETEGLTIGAPTWEVYMNDPDTTPPDELHTDIYVSLA